MTYRRRIEALSRECFNIEASLPIFDIVGVNSESQEFRRALYRLRIEINNLLKPAKSLDETTFDI
jgi:hypothetical protein